MFIFVLGLLGILFFFWYLDYGHARLPPRERAPRKTNVSSSNDNLLLILLAFIIGIEIGD